GRTGSPMLLPRLYSTVYVAWACEAFDAPAHSRKRRQAHLPTFSFVIDWISNFQPITASNRRWRRRFVRLRLDAEYFVAGQRAARCRDGDKSSGRAGGNLRRQIGV